MALPKTFDSVWEESIYGQGRHLNRYPFDAIVTFLFRCAPRDRPRGEVRVMEVGCGAGNNLWCAAREGFQVSGIDGSASAIAFAQERFAAEGLQGDLRVGDFTSLPFEDGSFDLVFDRCAVTCCGRSAAGQVVSEVRRTLRTGGRFFFNPYSTRCTSFASGTPGRDGLTVDIHEGSLAGVGQLRFYERCDIDRAFTTGWKVCSVQHVEAVEEIAAARTVHADWRVIAQKVETEPDRGYVPR